MTLATKILIVGGSADDQRAQYNVLASAELGWEIDFCHSGQAAPGKIGAIAPHCIVIDHQLPDIEGLDCFRAIQDIYGNNIPVLMLVAQNDTVTVDAILQAGVQDYLFKDNRGNYLVLLPTALKKALREHNLQTGKEPAPATTNHMVRRHTQYALTGLRNRAEFESTAARLLHSAKTMHVQHTLLFLEVDRFNTIHDSCGKIASDQLLRQLICLLLSHMRQSDTLAQLDSGDTIRNGEFAILLQGCPQQRAMEIAQNLADAVHAFRFEWEGRLLSVGISIGVVAMNGQTADIQAILSAADTACRIAKDQGRNKVQIFEYSNDETRAYHEKNNWTPRLQNAIEQNRFSLYRQAVQSLCAQRIVQHHEILLRYRNEQGHLVLPMTFIPAAERCGLSLAIDRWVIEKLFRTPPQSLFTQDIFPIAINLSYAAIADPAFQEFVLHELNASPIDPHSICFEVPEEVAVTNPHRATCFANAVKSAGCRLILDDFGNHLNSFSYLKSLPVDYVKIDGKFVKAIMQDAVDCAMVESIYRVAQVMHICTIAKCIESDDVLQRLHDIGIDYGQGTYLHVPQLM